MSDECHDVAIALVQPPKTPSRRAFDAVIKMYEFNSIGEHMKKMTEITISFCGNAAQIWKGFGNIVSMPLELFE